MSSAVSPDRGRDLTRFTAAMSWEQRFELIKRTFAAPLMGPVSPATEAAWYRAFDRDIELLGRILRDLLKSDQAVAGRPGPRPSLDRVKAEPAVDEWMGRDPTERPYSLMAFPAALALLAQGRTIRHVARLVGVSRMTVCRLLHGDIEPTRDEMVKVAAAFGKEPSYFMEYRIGTVAAAVAHKLTVAPQETVRMYEALFWNQTPVVAVT